MLFKYYLKQCNFKYLNISSNIVTKGQFFNKIRRLKNFKISSHNLNQNIY